MNTLKILLKKYDYIHMQKKGKDKIDYVPIYACLSGYGFQCKATSQREKGMRILFTGVHMTCMKQSSLVNRKKGRLSNR